MHSATLEDAIRHAPFRPFEIHADGRVIPVNHGEMILLTPNKATAVVAHENNHLSIIEMDHISSITLKDAPSRKRK